MAQHANSKIVTDNLVLHFDMNNPKSWIGAPTTNLLPGGAANGYPTTSSGWGTYNTNQYGSGSYFSIGTVSGVSSNIVTMSAAHSLRTYDVIRPQTTGGGVTAGTDYLVQKLSSNTFSLHAYTSDQTGATGFNTQNSVLFNQQIAINATSFPTMWWGAPHLPNSGLVKEIISKGFRFKNRVHDCMRIHYPRPEVDGMAYGVDAAVTPSTPHTVSFYARAVTSSAVGKGVSYQIYNYGANAAAGYSFGFTLGQVGVWEKKYMTFTPTNANCISYWFADPGPFSWELSEIMFNAGSVPLEYTETTRSSTQALLDLTKTSTATVNSLTYNANNTFTFTGSSSNNITVGVSNSSTNSISKSWEAWVMPTASQSTAGLFGHVVSTGCTYYCNGGVCIASSNYQFNWYDNANYQFLDSGVAATSNVPVHIVGTYDATDTKCRIYINGVLKNTSGATNMSYGGAANLVQIGYLSASGNYYTGNINVIRHYYNKALSAAEVRQNFSASRGRFGV